MASYHWLVDAMRAAHHDVLLIRSSLEIYIGRGILDAYKP